MCLQSAVSRLLFPNPSHYDFYPAPLYLSLLLLISQFFMVASWCGLEVADLVECTDVKFVWILTLRSPYLSVSLLFHLSSVFQLVFSFFHLLLLFQGNWENENMSMGEERGIRRIEGRKENDREKDY